MNNLGFFLRPFALPACVLFQKRSLLSVEEKKEVLSPHTYHTARLSNLEKMATAAEPKSGLTRVTFKDGRFQNPWPNDHEHNTRDIFTLIRTPDLSKIPGSKELDETLPVLCPAFKEFDSSPQYGVRTVWMGHASVLVQFDNITVLTDPIFSSYCSPVPLPRMKRYRNAPCSVEELPKVDAVVISHNHYDHLDVGTVKALNKKFGANLAWFVPMGLASWMKSCGCVNVTELSWWESASIPGREDVQFVATPSRHWCNRGLFDRNKVLWASWCVIGPHHRFFFAGDTAYCSGFTEIGKEFGPFDLSAIPIGAYYPRSFMESIHVNPEEAVQIHKDVKSKASVGIHWGTFKMTSEFYLEPKQKLEQIVQEEKMSAASFFTLKHGEVYLAGTDTYSDLD